MISTTLHSPIYIAKPLLFEFFDLWFSIKFQSPISIIAIYININLHHCSLDVSINVSALAQHDTPIRQPDFPSPLQLLKAIKINKPFSAVTVARVNKNQYHHFLFLYFLLIQHSEHFSFWLSPVLQNFSYEHWSWAIQRKFMVPILIPSLLPINFWTYSNALLVLPKLHFPQTLTDILPWIRF